MVEEKEEKATKKGEDESRNGEGEGGGEGDDVVNEKEEEQASSCGDGASWGFLDLSGTLASWLL